MMTLRVKLGISALIFLFLLSACAIPAKETKSEVDRLLQNAERLVKENRLSDALKEYQKAAELDPDCAVAYDRMAFLYMSAGDTGHAEQAAKTAIKLNPGLAISYNILGIIEENRKSYTSAEEFYKKAIQNDPQYARAYNNLGNIYNRRSDFENAESAYRKSIELEPRLAMAHNNLAYALEMEGKLPEAQKEYEKALELDRENQMAKNNLSRLKAKLAQPSATAEDRKIAESICAFSMPEGFRLVKGTMPEEGGKLAIFEHNYTQRIVIRELPKDNPINEALFSQMIIDYKPELLKLLEDLLKVRDIKIVGQGQTSIDQRRVLCINTEFQDEGTPMEGAFSVISGGQRSILIVALARKGAYRREITDSFLKNVRLNKKS